MLLQRQRDPLQKAVHPPGLGDLLLGGASSGPLPQWRCLRLAGVTDARARAGPWHEGGSHRATQTCVSDIDLDINIHVRKRRQP
jgi:hypothetical protein